MTVKFDVKLNGKVYLNSNSKIPISKDKIFKLSDTGTDRIDNVNIESIKSVK